MARLPPLPPNLRYLSRFRKHLARLGPGEVDPDPDLTIIREDVQKRVKGLSAEEACSLLRKDGAELDLWLSQPQHRNDVLNFLLPFLAMGAEDLLLEEDEDEGPIEYEVFVEFPSWIKGSKEDGIWSGKWRTVSVEIYPELVERMDEKVAWFGEQVRREPVNQYGGFELADVRFGDARGAKLISKGWNPIRTKGVEYVLQVPGGCVWVLLASVKEADFDETKVEAHFHTLRVVHHQVR